VIVQRPKSHDRPWIHAEYQYRRRGCAMKGNRGPTALAIVPLTLLFAMLPACCPSGAFVDNFGSLYQILTSPPPLEGMPFQTSGTADTRSLGCGVWNVRPPLPGESYDSEYSVVFFVENPAPDPDDNCCYGFRFEGNQQNPQCGLITGVYQSVGGKCTISGAMYLEAVQ
jgi:hypothetical protein